MSAPGKRSSFIPLFLSALAIVVIAAIAIRVSSYSAGDARSIAAGERADDASALPVAEGSGVPRSREAVTSPAETGTIVEGAPSMTPLSRAEERRRVFGQLLEGRSKQASPSAAPSPPPTVVAPAMTVASAPPAAQRPAVRPAPSPVLRSGSGSMPQQVSAPAPSPAPQPPPQANPDDPNSDSTPPQVVAIEFNPPQVRDGETTVLTIVAADNLSGVRNISGTIASPTGALQGYACQREADTNRFSTRVAIPKDAAEGMWNVSYVSLTDNASNSTQVTYVPPNVPPGASFRVTSSRPDSSGPTLKAIWVDRPSIRAGEKNTISVQADDDKAGVKVVSGIFVSPSKHARVGFNCQAGDGLNWRCTISPPACLDCGTWQLEQVQLQDNANNMTTLRADNPLVAPVHMDIFGENCDANPPVMQRIVLDKNSVSNAQATSINVTVVATDNLCGVGSVSGHATGPSRPGSVSRVYFALNPAGDGQSWSGPMNIPEKAPKGIWTITWVQVLDKGYNLKAYSQGEPLLGTATFRVE